MGLRGPTVAFSKMTLQQSGQYARNVPVVPDPNSVDSDLIKDLAVTEPKFADGAVSARATADKAITDAKLRDSNALSVIGRSTNTNGTPADIALDAAGKFLVRRANQIVGDTIQDADIPSSIARDTEVAAAITAHEAAGDPHPGYTTAAELAAAITAHEGAGNPHPVYLTQAEGDALYQPLATVLSMLHTGTGSPETVLTATVGHVYLRSDGGAGTTLYVKESGSGNTGWVGK
jgi:hypothetical protein